MDNGKWTVVIRALVHVVPLKNMHTLQDLIGGAVVMPGNFFLLTSIKHDKSIHSVVEAKNVISLTRLRNILRCSVQASVPKRLWGQCLK